jgi:Zn-dependent peptidase ImmA (M78 family)/transcriptional regulator with XRE-family HTH domain
MRQGTPGFVGARLRQGRDARGVSAISLSEIVGVTRSAMSQYEHGHQSPSPETMRRISNALNLPMHWFLRPVVPRETGPIFYRCMAAATKAARTRAQCRYEWLKDIVGLIQQYVKMPQIQLPSFDLPSDPAQISSSTVDDIASETRRFWGLKDGPISNVVWLLENRGAIVSRIELHASTLDAFSECDPVSSRPFVVLAADKQSAARSRFDAAHELGHIILHRHITQETLAQPASFELIEQQAHRFAGAFLLPAVSFGRECRDLTLDSFRSMKERWRVSIAAMVMRAHHLRLITDHHKTNLMINMGRRRWRTREPLDDLLEPERPRFLKKCFELLIKKGILPTSEASLMLGIQAEDIESLAGLDKGYLGRADSDVELADAAEIAPDDGMIIRFPYQKPA